jgi:hypothetical protein
MVEHSAVNYTAEHHKPLFWRRLATKLSPLIVPQLCPTMECQESRFSQGAAFKAMYQVLFDLVDPGRFPETAPAQPDAKNARDNGSAS